MSEETKQVWDNLFQKLNEKEKTFLAVVNNEKNKEIERLNNTIDSDNDVIKNQDLEIERLHFIINEVREYIGSKEHYEDDFDTEIEKVNKILDKENK